MKTEKEIVEKIETIINQHCTPNDYNDVIEGWNIPDFCYHKVMTLLWVLEDNIKD